MRSSPSKGHRRKEGPAASALTPVAVVVFMILLCTLSYMLGKGQIGGGATGGTSSLQGSGSSGVQATGGFLIAEGGLKVLDTADSRKTHNNNNNNNHNNNHKEAAARSTGTGVGSTDIPGSGMLGIVSSGASESKTVKLQPSLPSTAAAEKPVVTSGGKKLNDHFIDTKLKYTPDISDMSAETIIQQVTSLHSKCMTSLQFMTSTASKEALQFNAISNSDIHITHKLAKYIRVIVRNVTNSLDNHSSEEQRRSVEDLRRLMQGGHQCTQDQVLAQETIAKSIRMDICSEVEWYKVIQLAFPEATTFVDIGANKGYLGSLFLGLWGGAGLGVSPKKTFELSKRLDVWPKSRNPSGYCKDGLFEAAPLYCPSNLRNSKSGECLHRRDGVQVYSIDGSSYISSTMNGMIKQLAKAADAAEQGSGEHRNWRYYNFAMSDTVGTARFTKQSRDNNAGFEGGSIRRNAKPADTSTEEVNMTTVDRFLHDRHIEHVDVLKIDAEGQDNKVIFGASNAIRRSVALLTFEAGRGVQFLKPMVDEMDALGYSCYSTSRAGLFKYNGGCMSEAFIKQKEGDKGNVFCASRKRAPLVTLVMDLLAFPLLLQNEFSDAVLLGAESTDAHRAYVNIKGFCSPWPRCAAL